MASTASARTWAPGHLGTITLPATHRTQQPGFETRQIAYWSVATVVLQTLVSGLLVRLQLRRHLAGVQPPAAGGVAMS